MLLPQSLPLCLAFRLRKAAPVLAKSRCANATLCFCTVCLRVVAKNPFHTGQIFSSARPFILMDWFSSQLIKIARIKVKRGWLTLQEASFLKDWPLISIYITIPPDFNHILNYRGSAGYELTHLHLNIYPNLNHKAKCAGSKIRPFHVCQVAMTNWWRYGTTWMVWWPT